MYQPCLSCALENQTEAGQVSPPHSHPQGDQKGSLGFNNTAMIPGPCPTVEDAGFISLHKGPIPLQGKAGIFAPGVTPS